MLVFLAEFLIPLFVIGLELYCSHNLLLAGLNVESSLLGGAKLSSVRAATGLVSYALVNTGAISNLLDGRR